MTRADWTTIAEVFRRSIERWTKEREMAELAGDVTTASEAEGALYALRGCARQMADGLSRKHPRFDVERFLKTAGISQ